MHQCGYMFYLFFVGKPEGVYAWIFLFLGSMVLFQEFLEVLILIATGSVILMLLLVLPKRARMYLLKLLFVVFVASLSAIVIIRFLTYLFRILWRKNSCCYRWRLWFSCEPTCPQMEPYIRTKRRASQKEPVPASCRSHRRRCCRRDLELICRKLGEFQGDSVREPLKNYLRCHFYVKNRFKILIYYI